MKITSVKNPHVKNVVKLRNSHHRKVQNRFLIEGARCIGRAARAGVTIEEVFVCAERLTDDRAEPLVRQLTAGGARRFDVPAAVFDAMAYRHNPEGLLAVAVRPAFSLDNLSETDKGLYILAESLEKPGNLGAICRSADAVGVDGLILCDRRTDAVNPNAVRASTGTVFSVPLAEASVEEALAFCRARGVALLAATCTGGKPYTEVDMTGPIAFVLGAEHSGLTTELEQAADQRITIPMRGAADSLNVAATTTILLFEAARQRAAAAEGA